MNWFKRQIFALVVVSCLLRTSFACNSRTGSFVTGAPQENLKVEQDAYDFFNTILDGMSLSLSLLGPLGLGAGAFLSACLGLIYSGPSANVTAVNLTTSLYCLMENAISQSAYMALLDQANVFLQQACEDVQTYLTNKEANVSNYISNLQSALSNCETAFADVLAPAFSNSPGNLGSSLPVVIPLAMVHLAVLREFYINSYSMTSTGFASVTELIDIVNLTQSVQQQYSSFFNTSWFNFNAWSPTITHNSTTHNFGGTQLFPSAARGSVTIAAVEGLVCFLINLQVPMQLELLNF